MQKYIEKLDLFGGCPLCGANDECIVIRDEHWFVCHRHSMKWRIESNAYKNEPSGSQKSSKKREEKIKDYYNVEPIIPNINSGEIIMGPGFTAKVHTVGKRVEVKIGIQSISELAYINQSLKLPSYIMDIIFEKLDDVKLNDRRTPRSFESLNLDNEIQKSKYADIVNINT